MDRPVKSSQNACRNWRVSLCTRYRPLAVVLVFLLSESFLLISFEVLGNHRMTAWRNKLAHVSSGMTASSIAGMLGEPQEKSTIRSEEIQWFRDVNSEQLARLKRDNLEFVVFRYVKRFTPLTADSSDVSIYLDEHGEKTVAPPQNAIDLWVGVYPAMSTSIFLSSAALAFFAWLGLKLWSRKLEKTPLKVSAADGSRIEGER